MTSRASPEGSSLQLPRALALGFTGHRTLADESLCRKSVLDFLTQQKASANGLVYGVSSAAAGGDLLFAESCLQLGLPLRILLPFSVEEFRKDFDETSWGRAQQVLEKAASIQVIGGYRSREESYYECGIETVLESGLLLALWNGSPAEGLGGTADIVSFAEGLGRPVVWIESASGITRVLNEGNTKSLTDDPELVFLNGLPDPPGPVEIKNPEQLARAWFRKVDESATRLAPQFRRLAAAPIVCTAAAALCTGAGAWAQDAKTWLAAGMGLGILAALLPAALRLKKREIEWARTRAAAELCRSVLAFWGAPGPYEAIGAEMVPELSGVLMSLNYLKLTDRSRGEATLEEFKKRYGQERLAGQISYFSDHAASSIVAGRRYRIAIWSFVALALGISLWLFAVPQSGMETWRRGLALGASIAFQIATVAGALLAVNDYDRRRERFRELHQQLEQWDGQFAALRTWSSVLGVAGRIERALVTEVLEWRSFIRNRKLARR